MRLVQIAADLLVINHISVVVVGAEQVLVGVFVSRSPMILFTKQY